MSTLASLPSPSSNGFHLGPLLVHAYGLAYIAAVLAAIAITVRRWEARGGSRELVYEVALWGFPAGLIGGRLYFLATSWNEVPDHWWGPLAIWKGGLGIWGGIALGTLAGLLVLHRRRADIPSFLDAAAPALLVAQAIGRVGNYFNQELFGSPTGVPWGLEIDPAHRPAGYEGYATFHPTFLYELIWNLALAGALVWLGRRRRIKPPGLFALYVAGYSGFRIFEELLRVDPAHHILGLRLNFFVATLLCLAAFTWFVWIQRGAPSARRLSSRGGPAALGIAVLVCALAGCGHGQASDRLAVTKPEQHLRALPELVRGRDREVERVGDPVEQVEKGADICGVPEGSVAYARLPRQRRVFGPHVVRREGDFLEEAKRGPQLLVDRSRPPVLEHRLSQLWSERFRRDRAVGTRSERTLVELRRECREELALPHRPLGRAAHHSVDNVAIVLAEELAPIEGGLDDVRWLHSAGQPHGTQHEPVSEPMGGLYLLKPHSGSSLDRG